MAADLRKKKKKGEMPAEEVGEASSTGTTAGPSKVRAPSNGLFPVNGAGLHQSARAPEPGSLLLPKAAGTPSLGGSTSYSAEEVANLKEKISFLQSKLRSADADEQLQATKEFRQLLSVERSTILQDALDKEIIPQLLEFLKQSEHAQLQVEALWALTNVAAGTSENTQLLLKNDTVPILVSLLSSTHQEVLEQAVWVLGNIAGDGPKARDRVLRAEVLSPLLKCMKENPKTSLLRIATWTLSNLCDGQPRPNLDVASVLVVLRDVLNNEDSEILSHSCWALSHLCDGPSPHIEAVVQANVCERLVQLLDSKFWRVVKPALRTIGNIVCAEDEIDYTANIIECGAVPCLRELITHSNREIQKEACWTLSNIAAGTTDQIQKVLDSGCIPTLVNLASEFSDVDQDVRIEACWVLLNSTSCGSDSQIEFLVRQGCVAVLCNLLHDSSMVMMALEGLEKILQVGEESNIVIPLTTGNALKPKSNKKSNGQSASPTEVEGIELELNGLTAMEKLDELGRTSEGSMLLTAAKIKELLSHKASQINKRAKAMWNKYFVVCAICDNAYSRRSTVTRFCSECKCHVCSNCDCTRFHLSYQDQLWKELAEEDAKQEREKQQTKKSKRQKKKAKDKRRRELQKAAAKVDEEVAKKKLHQQLAQPASPKKEINEADDSKQEDDDEESESDETDPEQSPDSNANGATSVNDGGAIKPEDLPPELVAVDDDPLTAHNDAYVDFLNNKGSILDLWNIMQDDEVK